MAGTGMSLKQRAAAGLVTRCRAGRRDWYLTRHAARYLRKARAYTEQRETRA